jgi:hypothetical protein
MMRPTESAAPREHVADAPGWWQRVWRRLMPPPSAELVLDQLNRQLAVLEGGRADLEVGWVQGGWWSVTSADGNQRLVTGYAAAGGGSPDHVDGSCLVGALARVGSPSDAAAPSTRSTTRCGPPATSRPRRGRRTAAGAAPGSAGPGAHAHPVNDQAGRTQEEVLTVVDRAISATIMDLMAAPRPAQPAQLAQCADGP